MRAKRVLAAISAAGCVALLAAPEAAAASGPIFTVMNTSESPPDGVYFRNSPSWNDTSRTYGLGVFMNEQVQLECYASGQPIGQYNDSLWYYVLNVTRPVNYDGEANQGMLNAHYINDHQDANVVDAGVPACVNNRPPVGVQPPPPQPAVALAQGPAAPQGYRYAISLSGFAANAAVSVSCRDSVDPGGFYTFTLQTDTNGQASTAGYCYSGDGPDHWVVANGVESNHVAWTSPMGSGTPPNRSSGSSNNPPPGTSAAGTASPSTPTTGPNSVFYSGTNNPNGSVSGNVATHNFGYSTWAVGNCRPDGAVAFSDNSVGTLAGWSKGRLGVVYFLAAAGAQRVNNVRTIILFDPGSTADIAKPPFWRRWVGDDTCDWHYDINSLLAGWLSSNDQNHLMVLTGKDSEEKVNPNDRNSKSQYLALWKYYFAGIWNQPFANRALVCDYNMMDHPVVLSQFYSLVQYPTFACRPSPSKDNPLTQWNP